MGQAGDSHAPAHGHSDSHDHTLFGDWGELRSARTLQAVRAAVVAAAIVTLIGVIALWPSDEGRDEAVANAAAIGIGSDRFEAEVIEVRDAPCSYSTEDRPQDCRTISALVLTISVSRKSTSPQRNSTR